MFTDALNDGRGPFAWRREQIMGALVLMVGWALPALAEIPVTTATVSRRDVQVFTRGIGTVQAYRSVLVRARVDGTLEDILFREGQDVKPGDVLAHIDPRPYAAALAQAQAKRAADAAQVQNARLDLARYSALARSSIASRQQVDTQTALLAQYSATLQGDEAAVANAALNLSFCQITSPIQGVVGLRQVDVGNQIHASDSAGIVTIAQVHPISLIFTLPQDELPAVRDAIAEAASAPGPNAAPLVIATTSDGSMPLAEGRLLTTDNTIDTQTGTISLKAVFENKANHLWPGQFTAARLRLRIARNVVTLAPASIQHGPDGLFVYLVKPDQTVARANIKVGYEDEDAAIVTEGLSGGETVVVRGQVRLQDGAKIGPAKS